MSITQTSIFSLRRMSTICAMSVLLLSALLATTALAEIPPWMIGDEQEIKCYFLNKTEMPTPPGIHLQWVTPPSEDMTSDRADTVEYSVDIDPEFWSSDDSKKILTTSYNKWNNLCTNKTAAEECSKTNSKSCCIFHSNIHSCRTNTGVCEPWVKAQNCSGGACDGTVLVTHTGAQVGGAEPYFHDVKLPNGTWIMIAHIKIMNFQCAVGATRTVSEPTPEVIRETFQHLTAVVVGVLLPIVIIALLGVAVFKYLRYRKVANAPTDSKQFYSMFVQLKKETSLWEARPERMPEIINKYHSIVGKAASSNGCYVVKHFNGATMITAKTNAAILECATAVAKNLHAVKWDRLVNNLPAAQYERKGSSVVTRESRKQSTVGSPNNRSAVVEMENSTLNASAMSQSMNASMRSQIARLKKVHIEFSIGVHCGSGVIRYDEERHAYDYSGPAVDGAAVSADKAQGFQTLVTNSIAWEICEGPNAGGRFNDGQIVEFCTTEWGGETVLSQFNAPGVAVRLFRQAEEEDEEQACDSIASVLEQQNAGVTSKKVTVACIHLTKLEAKSKTMSKDAFARHYTERMTNIKEFAENEKGCIHSIVGSKVIVTFNAATPAPQATTRAFAVVSHVKDLEDGHVTAGIAADTGIVGSFSIGEWKHDCVVSKVTDTASLLQRMCTLYADAEDGNPAYCLAQNNLVEEFNCFGIVEAVDVVRWPGLAKPKLVISIHGYKPAQDCDEWMYELENAAAGNKYFASNQVFEKILQCPDDKTPEDFQEALDAIPEDSRDHMGYNHLIVLSKMIMSSGRKDSGMEEFVGDKKLLL